MPTLAIDTCKFLLLHLLPDATELIKIFSFVSVQVDTPYGEEESTFTLSASGLDTQKQYKISYYWAAGEISDSMQCRLVFRIGSNIYDARYVLEGAQTRYEYRKQVAVFTPPAPNIQFDLGAICQSNSDLTTTGRFLVDDVSIQEYTPVCQVKSPSPQGLRCGVNGHFSPRLIPRGGSDETSLDACAKSCIEQSCEYLVFVRYANTGDEREGRTTCSLYRLPLGGGQAFLREDANDLTKIYQPDCFKCYDNLSC